MAERARARTQAERFVAQNGDFVERNGDVLWGFARNNFANVGHGAVVVNVREGRRDSFSAFYADLHRVQEKALL